MKKILVLLSLCVAGSMTLSAQSAIKVKKGEKFSYRTDMSMSVTQSMQGQEMTVDSKMESTADLAAKKIGKEQIDWTYGLARMRVLMESPMLPGGKVDTTYKGEEAKPFTTDLSGRLTKRPDVSNDLQAVTGGVLQAGAVETMFSPILARGAKPGDSWEEKSYDTVSNPALAGIAMIITRNTKYTFEAIVDTLGRKSTRLRADVTGMTIEGEGEYQGATMNIAGDGTATTTAYYGVEDGMLLASATESEVSTRMTISGPMQVVVPMSYKVSATTVRNK